MSWSPCSVSVWQHIKIFRSQFWDMFEYTLVDDDGCKGTIIHSSRCSHPQLTWLTAFIAIEPACDENDMTEQMETCISTNILPSFEKNCSVKFKINSL